MLQHVIENDTVELGCGKRYASVKNAAYHFVELLCGRICSGLIRLNAPNFNTALVLEQRPKRSVSTAYVENGSCIRRNKLQHFCSYDAKVWSDVVWNIAV